MTVNLAHLATLQRHDVHPRRMVARQARFLRISAGEPMIELAASPFLPHYK